MIKTRRKSIRDDINESWLTDNENRSVELNELIITAELNDLSSLTVLNDLSDLTLSISICWYCGVSAIWLTEKQNRDVELSLLLKMLNLNFCWVSKFDALIDLINDVKFASSAIYEVFAFWLTEKQTRDVELKQLMKVLNDRIVFSRVRQRRFDANIFINMIDVCSDEISWFWRVNWSASLDSLLSF